MRKFLVGLEFGNERNGIEFCNLKFQGRMGCSTLGYGNMAKITSDVNNPQTLQILDFVRIGYSQEIVNVIKEID